ncbi:hypothetical protein M9458_048766, partial [Cirrhinus mrigala]
TSLDKRCQLWQLLKLCWSSTVVLFGLGPKQDSSCWWKSPAVIYCRPSALTATPYAAWAQCC